MPLMPFDASQFREGLRRGQQQYRDRALAGMNGFAAAVRGGAAAIAPVGGGIYSPRDPAPGTLAGSAYQTPAVFDGNRITAEIGFNTVYALRQHEELDWRHEQGQSKYLEATLREKAPQMIVFIGQMIGAA
jgi:hypothetical protein